MSTRIPSGMSKEIAVIRMTAIQEKKDDFAVLITVHRARTLPAVIQIVSLDLAKFDSVQRLKPPRNLNQRLDLNLK